MKKIVLMLFVAVAAVNAYGQKKNVYHEYSESSARNIEPEQVVVTTPLIADLQIISGRISHTETEAFKNINVTDFINELGEDAFARNLVEWKKIALSRAAQQSKADLIIGSIIDIVTNDSNHLEITVSGYPAVYTKFRNITSGDITLISSMRSFNEQQRNEDVLHTQTISQNTKVVEKEAAK